MNSIKNFKIGKVVLVLIPVVSILILLLPLILIIAGQVGGSNKLNELFKKIGGNKPSGNLLEFKYGSSKDKAILKDSGISNKDISEVDMYAEVLLAGIILLIMYALNMTNVFFRKNKEKN